jgi:hypothetical protein
MGRMATNVNTTPEDATAAFDPHRWCPRNPATGRCECGGARPLPADEILRHSAELHRIVRETNARIRRRTRPAIPDSI